MAAAEARWGSAFWHALAWAVFGCAYAGCVVFVASYLRAPGGAGVVGVGGGCAAIDVYWRDGG